MPSVPRILRAVPRGAITRSERGIPVMATLHWNHGAVAHIPALAKAWTQEAVEVMWETPDGDFRTDWLPARDVTRIDSRGQRVRPGESDPDPDPLADLPRRPGSPEHGDALPRGVTGSTRHRW